MSASRIRESARGSAEPLLADGRSDEVRFTRSLGVTQAVAINAGIVAVHLALGLCIVGALPGQDPTRAASLPAAVVDSAFAGSVAQLLLALNVVATIACFIFCQRDDLFATPQKEAQP
jgi:hypothetical protein